MRRIYVAPLVFVVVAASVAAVWFTWYRNLPLHDEIAAIKDRLDIVITEANFTNPVRKCDFYEVRQQASDEYFQTTVGYQVFQNGKGIHGDMEAYVEIYNEPVRTDLFHVEVARLCWNELTVYFDGKNVTTFHKVQGDWVPSEGYINFPVPTP